MDISQQYVKMCEKAVEIRQQWNPIQGDYFLHKLSDVPIQTVSLEMIEGREMDCECCKGQRIWLPRQDQLSTMLFDHAYVRFAHRLIEADRMNTNCLSRFGDNEGEKMWLAFVMKEKYGKVWDGENWVYKEGR